MSSAKGLRQVGFFDCPGGGQIVVAGTIAFIGHMRAPAGTSIVDVADPAIASAITLTKTRLPKIFAAGSASTT